MSSDDGLAERVREALQGVIDPELGFNIVDLGLVYDITIQHGGAAQITMTTTTPGCPATEYLLQGAGQAAQSIAGITRADVQLTHAPPWMPDMMSDIAKAYFGMQS
jgi:metal-sulfur cluster biosynthetic enzyme